MTDLKLLLHHCYKRGLLQPSTVESCIKESCLIHAMKTWWGSRGRAPLILNLNLGEEWSTPCHGHFTPREESIYPLNKRLGGPTACLDISEKRKITWIYWGPKSVSCSLQHSHYSSFCHTQTSNQQTLHIPVCIMYCTESAVMPTVPGGTCSFFQLNLFVLWTVSWTVCIFSSHLH